MTPGLYLLLLDEAMKTFFPLTLKMFSGSFIAGGFQVSFSLTHSCRRMGPPSWPIGAFPTIGPWMTVVLQTEIDSPVFGLLFSLIKLYSVDCGPPALLTLLSSGLQFTFLRDFQLSSTDLRFIMGQFNINIWPSMTC